MVKQSPPKLKILITVDPEIPVPPTNYGGIERIVDGLASEYKKRGYEVILIAHPESRCVGAKKIYGWEKGMSRGVGNVYKNALQLLKIYRSERPDVIHSFSRLLYLYPLFLLEKAPVVQTYQRAISEKSTSLASLIAGKQLQFTACAGHTYRHLNAVEKWHTVYNFTDTEYFKPDTEVAKEHLLFLGRIEEIKGTKEAIEVAKKTGIRLIIAGNIPEEKRKYFKEYIEPECKNGLIEYVGPVNDAQKLKLFQGAKAFLFPIRWEEPFGIVMAESMACGTPVVAFNRGSVPEVVQNNKTGFILNSIDEMVEAVNRIDDIDRNKVRQDAVRRFSLKEVAKEYIALYSK